MLWRIQPWVMSTCWQGKKTGASDARAGQLHNRFAIDVGLLGAAQHDGRQDVAQPIEAVQALFEHGGLAHEGDEGRPAVVGLVAQEHEIGEELLGAVLQGRAAHRPPLLCLPPWNEKSRQHERQSGAELTGSGVSLPATVQRRVTQAP